MRRLRRWLPVALATLVVSVGAVGCNREIGVDEGPAAKLWFQGDFDQALDQAAARNKLIFLEFHADW